VIEFNSPLLAIGCKSDFFAWGEKNGGIRPEGGDGMIEITMTETAKIELLKILEHFSNKTIRLIQQGDG
jgi:hypothetical protein